MSLLTDFSSSYRAHFSALSYIGLIVFDWTLLFSGVILSCSLKDFSWQEVKLLQVNLPFEVCFLSGFRVGL